MYHTWEKKAEQSYAKEGRIRAICVSNFFSWKRLAVLFFYFRSLCMLTCMYIICPHKGWTRRKCGNNRRRKPTVKCNGCTAYFFAASHPSQTMLHYIVSFVLSIIVFAGAPVVKIQGGSIMLTMRITCYSRHHLVCIEKKNHVIQSRAIVISVLL